MSYLDLPIVGKGSLYSDLWMIMRWTWQI